MSLAKRSSTPNGTIHGGPCSVALLLETLDKAEAKALQKILDSPWRVWPHLRVEAELRDEGLVVGQGQVGKHRRRACRCYKAVA